MKKLFLLLLILPFLIYGYGYWRSLNYGYAQVSLNFNMSDSSEINILPNAKVQFINTDQTILATGLSDEKYNFVYLKHPSQVDCHKIVKNKNLSFTEAGYKRQRCLQDQLTWVPKWIKKVQFVKIIHQQCTTDLMPITIKEYDSAWKLWWVPLPHVGGSPHSYFTIDIDINKSDCIISNND